MQSLTRMDKVVIDDYYHATTMNETMNWMKLTHLLSIFSQNLTQELFCTFPTTKFLIVFCKSTLTSKFLTPYLNVRTEEKKKHLSLMYTMYANPPKNTPSYTHISSYIT